MNAVTTNAELRQQFSVQNIRTLNRDLNLLDSNLYSVDIHFSGFMLSQAILDWDSLSLDAESKKKLKESKTRISAIPLFANLSELGKELTKLRTQIYTKTILCEGQRVTTEAKIGKVLEEINSLYNKADELRNQLEEQKEEGLEKLRVEVRSFLEAPIFQLLPSEIEERLVEVEQIFYEKVRPFELLKVTVDLNKKVSLSKQIETSTELSEAIARRETARNSEAEALALRRINSEKETEIIAFNSRITEDIKNEITEIIATQLEGIKGFEIDKNNALTKKKLDKHLDRIDTLMSFNLGDSQNFATAKAGLEKLHEAYEQHNLGNKSSLNEKLASIRAELDNSLNDTQVEEAPTIKVRKLSFD